MASIDALTPPSRAFYERSKLKMAASIVLGASCMMLLGFTANSGGQAAAANYNANEAQALGQDSNTVHQYQALSGGFGFGAFVYILAFILLGVAAAYVSPVVCGTSNEVKMLRTPHELEANMGASAGAPLN
jgi:hypothetical protein